MGILLVLLFLPGVWLPRSAPAAKAGADSVAASRPDPESVRAGAVRLVQARMDAI